MRSAWIKIVGIAIIGWIVWRLDFGAFARALSSIDGRRFAASFAFLLIFILLKCVRWHSLLRIQRIRFSLSQAVAAYVIGQFLGSVTPGKLGDFAKVFYLEKDAGVSHFRATSSVLADRLCDMAMLFLLAVAGLYLGVVPEEYELACEIFGFLVALAALPFLHRRLARHAFHLLTRLPLIGARFARRERLIRDFYDGFRQFKSWQSITPIALTIAAYIALFAHAQYLARSLSIEASPLQIVFIVVIGNIASLVPVSIGGVGPREITIQALFVKLLHGDRPLTASLVSMLQAQGLAFSLAFYGVFVVTVGVAGGLAWLHNPIRVDSLKRLAVELSSTERSDPSNSTR